MSISILIGFITYIVYIMLNNKKEQEEKIKKELLNTVLELKLNKLENNYNVIEIKNEKEDINYQEYLIDFIEGVPEWKHHYVYDAKEIELATLEQKKFYKIFKESFLNGVFYNLEQNSNYSFILLFDLRDEYNQTKEWDKLENRIKQLGLYYPKTKYYGKSILIDKLDSLGDYNGISRLNNDRIFQGNIYDYNYDIEYWNLGNRLKKKLNLSNFQTELLNFRCPSNTFCLIEFNLLNVVNVYLKILEGFCRELEEQNISFQEEINRISAIKNEHYMFSYDNNSEYHMKANKSGILEDIFKHCENIVREKYEHKRKLDQYFINRTKKSNEDLFEKLIDYIEKAKPDILENIPVPDEKTEIELNSQNTTRWKNKLERLKNNYNDPVMFYKQIILLGEQNKKNPSIENIFLDASKLMVSSDKIIALELYLRYIYHDALSVSFSNKKLTTTTQKKLFKNQDQIIEFEKIVEDLIKSRDLNSSLEKLRLIFEVKRKEVKLNQNKILRVQRQHTGTVDLLNEYLIDDEENVKEIGLNLGNDTIQIEKSFSNEEMKFTETQILLIELFKNSKYKVLQSDVDLFAKSKNILKNYLIDSINEKCYEIIDDILIEENDEYYIINEVYFKMILNND